MSLSCYKATELLEKGKVVDLTIVERVKLVFHLRMCKVCKAYKSESHLIDAALFNAKEVLKDTEGNTAQLQEKIKVSLKDKNK